MAGLFTSATALLAVVTLAPVIDVTLAPVIDVTLAPVIDVIRGTV